MDFRFFRVSDVNVYNQEFAEVWVDYPRCNGDGCERLFTGRASDIPEDIKKLPVDKVKIYYLEKSMIVCIVLR